MNRSLLTIGIHTNHGQLDEFHLILPSITKVFRSPFSKIIVEIPASTSLIPFQGFSHSKLVISEKLSTKETTSNFSFSDHKQSIQIDITLTPIKQAHSGYSENLKKPIKGSLSKVHLNDFFEEKSYDIEMYTNYLENLVKGVEKKLEVSQLKSVKDTVLEEVHNFVSVVPENLRKVYEKTCDKLKDVISEKDKIINTLKGQLEKNQKTIEEERRIKEIKAKNEEKLNVELSHMKAELIKLKSESRNFTDMGRTIEKLQIANKTLEESLDTFKNKLKSQEYSYNAINKQLQLTIDSVINENLSLQTTSNNLKQELSALQSKYNVLINDYTKITIQNTRENDSSSMLEKILSEKKPDSNIHLINELNRHIENLKAKNAQLVLESKKERDELLKKSNEYLTEIKKLKNNPPEGKKEINHIRRDSDNIKKNQMRKSTDSLVISESRFLVDSKDLLAQFEILKEKSVYVFSGIYDHSEYLSNRLLEGSRQLMYYQGIITKLVEALRECRGENLSLRERLFLNRNTLPLYIPVKGDPIDFAMAEYVNNLPKPLKIPFVRHDPGFYLFGSRNARLRLIANRLFIVFSESFNMGIDEYVNKFTREEAIKLEDNKGQAESKLEEEKKNLSSSARVRERKSTEDSSYKPQTPMSAGLSTSVLTNHRSNSGISFESPGKYELQSLASPSPSHKTVYSSPLLSLTGKLSPMTSLGKFSPQVGLQGKASPQIGPFGKTSSMGKLGKVVKRK
ncbi:hypothetical protein SteCoe_30604 [Stentor coeruleus]|uniref:Uncharacterized protein n=1 Tax=Stentor coeruleus TaxID=5963 RepID=A0A1R2B383_9CILI|nr:hypothetical protein SteCoe_30604 [Stentor coeruleus]